MKNLNYIFLICVIFFLTHNITYAQGLPTIVLIGPCLITQPVNTKYYEPGYIAKDSMNNDISNMVIVMNNIDTAVPGRYSVVYCITSGAVTKCVRRNIVVAPIVNDTIYYSVCVPLLFQTDTITKAKAYLSVLFGLNITQNSGTVDSSQLGSYPLGFVMADSACGNLNLLLTINVVDTITLAIQLLGPPFICIEVNTSFIDPGYFYYDNYWPLNSLVVTKTSNLDSSKKGLYTITYTLTNPSGFVRNIVRQIQVGDCNTGLSGQQDIDGYKIYPNPVIDYLYIENSNSNAIIENVIIYDYQGKAVKEYKMNEGNKDLVQLNTSGLLPGLYLLKIKDNLSFRFIIKP
ncbi:MAG: DUF5011 domain-containing protein [Bacteroidota bacterium]|nr:DUF5011 domain-containing protein [Bacteroidota bacterium]